MLSNTIQNIGNSFYSLYNQNYNYSSNESSSVDSINDFTSVLKAVENSSIINYSTLSSGVSNVPMGITSGINSYGTTSNNLLNSSQIESSNNSLENLIDNNVSVNNNGSNYIEVTNKNSTQKQQIEDAVKKASEKHGIDENLIKAVMKTESNFNPNAVSSVGAKGLMQVMPANYKHLGISNPFDIYQNIDGGTKLLREYLDKYNGDVEMALMAYNGGPTRMKNRGVTSVEHIYKMPKETQNYVKKVMNYYRGG